jgi:VIT1/CCC1 family predicted Fe2+/Mn2+ transporter
MSTRDEHDPLYDDHEMKQQTHAEHLDEHRPAPLEKKEEEAKKEETISEEDNNKKKKSPSDSTTTPASSTKKSSTTAAVAVAATSSKETTEKSRREAQKAFELRDAEKSREEHDKSEPHGSASGEMVKATVFGGLDGIMTIFAVVTAAAGGSGGGSWQIVLVFGLSNLVADAWAMGFGEFLGGMAELDQAVHEREREIWEFETNPEEEKEELKLIYMKKGYPEEDAQGIVDILSKNRDHFIDAMMKDELGISADIDDWYGPLKSGGVMFASFCCFGLVPLLPYFAGSGGKGIDKVFITSCCLVGVSLVLLGCVKGYLTNRPMAQMAMAMLFSGAISGVSSFLVANVLDLMVQ